MAGFSEPQPWGAQGATIRYATDSKGNQLSVGVIRDETGGFGIVGPDNRARFGYPTENEAVAAAVREYNRPKAMTRDRLWLMAPEHGRRRPGALTARLAPAASA